MYCSLRYGLGLIDRWLWLTSLLGMLLATGNDLRCDRLDLVLQLIELFGHDILVVREVSLEPMESSLLIITVDELFELRHLGIRHFLGQTCTDPDFQGLVHVLEKSALFLFW